ncbi:hypothetical protein BpHYR1_040759 [Brachionus plicatilis]|uniref:Uncharacterized protein n=1 Tax=Brachionus plicatilis TaxID=10195 RepID=A0A3M7PRS5_BRAPC|nr:hypothetical protein BpHYR1_040759 [Brachionus plicatilis]
MQSNILLHELHQNLNYASDKYKYKKILSRISFNESIRKRYIRKYSIYKDANKCVTKTKNCFFKKCLKHMMTEKTFRFLVFLASTSSIYDCLSLIENDLASKSIIITVAIEIADSYRISRIVFQRQSN